MRRIGISLVAVGVLLVGGWYLSNQRSISSLGDALRLASQQLTRLRHQGLSDGGLAVKDLRVASFNIQAFGPDKAREPIVMSYLAQIVAQFDVLAVQELRGQDSAAVAELVKLVNSTGRNYAFIASEPVGNPQHLERYAFIYNGDRLTLDDSHSYLVNDPEDLLHREPLVAWFRAVGPDPASAFTFSLVNVHLDSRQPEREAFYLAQTFRAIRTDGRGEDDVILVGDFNIGPEILAGLKQHAGLTCLIVGTPTTVRGTHQFDNLLIDPTASSEYTGRSGVFDFLRIFNLTIDQAIDISDHLPVWAEFRAIEGGNEIRMASNSPVQ